MNLSSQYNVVYNPGEKRMVIESKRYKETVEENADRREEVPGKQK